MAEFSTKRGLLNPSFEGYKFAALDQETVATQYALEYKATQAALSGRSSLSFQEVQSRIRHNHLVVHESGRALYIDESLRLIVVELEKDTLQPLFRIAYELPSPIQTDSQHDIQREYPSAAFLTDSVCAVADGYGYLYVVQIPAQGGATLLGTLELPDNTVPFRIHQGALVSPSEATLILSSCTHIDRPVDAERPTRPAITKVEYDIRCIRFSVPVLLPQDRVQAMDVIWHRKGEDVPLYTYHDSARHAWLLVGSSIYRPASAPSSAYEPSADELAPVPRKDENLEAAVENKEPPPPPPYSWTQTGDTVSVAFALPRSTPKSDIKVAFSPKSLTVFVSGETTLSAPLPRFSKTLWDGIQPTSSVWTWDREAEKALGLLTVHLDKQHEGTRWPQVFTSTGSASEDPYDVEVPETLDPSELANILESMEKFTIAARTGEDASGLGLGTGVPSFAKGEMDDEVDVSVGSAACVTWVSDSGDTLPMSTKNGDGTLQLLSTPIPGISEPSLIGKNGVDGVVFTLSPASSPDGPAAWSHTSTFSALAFVLASKRDVRFTYHVPSKAVLAFESGSGAGYGGNLYLYRSTKPKDTSGQQSILRVGGGAAGSLLGVGGLKNDGQLIILCLCEEGLFVLRGLL